MTEIGNFRLLAGSTNKEKRKYGKEKDLENSEILPWAFRGASAGGV
jgi:hypothetical protein